MKTILVTGANRGLGLEWVRQYSDAGWRVLATCRDPDSAEELQALAGKTETLGILRLDVTDAEQVAALRAELQGQALHLLVNNAGVYFERWGKDHLGSINYDDWLETFAVNVLGAVRVTEALEDSLVAAEPGLAVAISSHMGCVSDIASPNDYAYRSSKAAMNAAFHGLAYELGQKQVGVLLLHPGWVNTRMGGNSAPVTVEESVRGMRALVDSFTPQDSGRFIKYDGRDLPW